MNHVTTAIIFILAALFEVGGDAAIRMGLRGRGLAFIVAGFLVLGGYGLVVNMVKWDFGKLLGVYVAAFALISLLFSRFVFKEAMATTTLVGLLVIMVGGMIIQFGSQS